ncbi:hypothetical protein RvY_17239 [Ramazzottius varieornatus]|uniref:Uncharacterized protein n=1 Tax=Ramazzottius varieornatus TaxID=947166 RepID=A0A1D1W1F7_RAMVA|nr:hypothetical protein RvY_17239 [Ramazzottius varieornatus]
MENFERGWQATTPKIRKRLEHVLDSIDDFPPNVQFAVELPDEKPETIGAHRFLYTDEIDVYENDRSPDDYQPEAAWLTSRTTECARKYDIPELYFACRAAMVKILSSHDEDKPAFCTTILLEVSSGLGSTVDRAQIPKNWSRSLE